MFKTEGEQKANLEKDRLQEVKGLGDLIAGVTKATGIKTAVEVITGGNCGCDKRQEKLNKLFPFKK